MLWNFFSEKIPRFIYFFTNHSDYWDKCGQIVISEDNLSLCLCSSATQCFGLLLILQLRFWKTRPLQSAGICLQRATICSARGGRSHEMHVFTVASGGEDRSRPLGVNVHIRTLLGAEGPQFKHHYIYHYSTDLDQNTPTSRSSSVEFVSDCVATIFLRLFTIIEQEDSYC